MPRVARVVAPGIPHHITQRGNNRQDVFFTDDDRWFYLAALKELSERHQFQVIAYCLMRNHVHLVGIPTERESLAKTVGGTHVRHARHINERHGRSGHLWQNRFFSCPLDGPHCLAAIRYVERNPVRAKLVRVAWRYPWSSAPAHAGGPDRTGLLDLHGWRQRFDPDQWRAVLQDDQDEDEAMTAVLRRRTFNGRPLGTDRFIARLEAILNRRLRPQPVGRPRIE